jgi:hypothetical protein
MGAEESSIKKIISIVGREYSILKEDTKLDECGWSKEVYDVWDPAQVRSVVKKHKRVSNPATMKDPDLFRVGN